MNTRMLFFKINYKLLSVQYNALLFVDNFPSQGNGALISHFMHIQFMNFENGKESNED
jgi:hypothetical protein